MANVQTVTSVQGSLSGAPLSITPPPDAFGANVVGEGLQKTGAAEQQVSDILAKHAETVQAINNQNSADQANQQYAYLTAQSKEKYKNDLLAALSKDPGLDTGAFLGNYLKQNEADRNQLADGLGNVMAKQMFHQESRRLASLNAGNLAAETASAWREAGINTAKASIQLEQGIAIQGGGDTRVPAVQGAMLGIWNQIYKVGKIRGDSPEAKQALFQSAVSPIYKNVFDSKLDVGDLAGAEAVLSAHAAHDLTPDDLDRMQRALKTGIAQNNIQSPVSDIYDKGVSPTTPNRTTDLSDAFLQQESGNNSNVQVSVNGAIGPGQIQPNTFSAYAKPGERIDNPEDNRAVQKRIIADYQQKYNGDVGRIATAYFSGPGNVAPAGSPTPYIHDYKDGNGKHVSSYVSDMEARVGAVHATEAPPKFGPDADPADVRDQMLAYNQRVAMQLYPGSPEDRARFIAAADTRANLMANITNDHQLTIFNQLNNMLLQGTPNGNAIHSFEDFPASLTSQLSSSYRTKLIEQVEYAREGILGHKTPEMEANAQALVTLSGSNTTAFLNTDLTRVPLSAPDFMKLAGLKASLQRNANKISEQQTKISTLISNPIVKNIINQQFEQPGTKFADVRPVQGGDYVSSPGHLSFIGALLGEVERAQASHPKPLTQEEVGKIANNLLVQQSFENNPDYVYIDKDFKDFINQQTRQRSGRDATPDELAYLYHKNR